MGGTFTDQTGLGCNGGDAARCLLTGNLIVDYDQGLRTSNYSEEYGDYTEDLTNVEIHDNNVICYLHKNPLHVSEEDVFTCHSR